MCLNHFRVHIHYCSIQVASNISALACSYSFQTIGGIGLSIESTEPLNFLYLTFDLLPFFFFI